MTQYNPDDNPHGCLLDNSGDYDPDCPFCQMDDDPFFEHRRVAELANPDAPMTRLREALIRLDGAA